MKKLARRQGNLAKWAHVDFAYRDGLAVLRDVDLHIRPGETVAVVGPSGGGKSTLCQLIPRFYDVTSGAVRMDAIVAGFEHQLDELYQADVMDVDSDIRVMPAAKFLPVVPRMTTRPPVIYSQP